MRGLLWRRTVISSKALTQTTFTILEQFPYFHRRDYENRTIF